MQEEPARWFSVGSEVAGNASESGGQSRMPSVQNGNPLIWRPVPLFGDPHVSSPCPR